MSYVIKFCKILNYSQNSQHGLTCLCQKKCYSRGYAIARCQAKTTLKSYWHELRDHQEYSKKIAMKTGTWVWVPVPMTTRRDRGQRS